MKTYRLESPYGTVELLEHGAHLCSWICEGREQLFVSKHAIYEQGKALRGGVPICFPQFAAFGPGQKHGFARNVTWQLESITEQSIKLSLESDEQSLALWPHEFLLNFEVELRKLGLVMSLNVSNTGSTAFDFGAALHSYFKIEDAEQVELSGLQGCICWDNGNPLDQRYRDQASKVKLAGPIDRVYFGTERDVAIEEEGTLRRIAKTGFKDVVVWNPWREGAAVLLDMADSEYRNMICVEAAAVDNRISLNPGENWQGTQNITLLQR